MICVCVYLQCRILVVQAFLPHVRMYTKDNVIVLSVQMYACLLVCLFVCLFD